MYSINSSLYSNSNILVKDKFTQEKMEDQFVEVEFTYPQQRWIGVIPIKLIYQGLIITETKLSKFLDDCYCFLDDVNIIVWNESRENYWKDKTKGQTYNVLLALDSGDWECRGCGPVTKVNPQPSSRLRDLKKMGYVISSKRQYCTICKSNQMHDILVKIPRIEAPNTKVRFPISKSLEIKIKNLLNNKEVCFNVQRQPVELVIDHKYPSQRWADGETPNPENMTEQDITNKFQLLSNQTNLWKSRYCDRCVKEGKRGDYMGIKWYYEGDDIWRGKDNYDEQGCVGCPWYDLNTWRESLNEFIANK